MIFLTEDMPSFLCNLPLFIAFFKFVLITSEEFDKEILLLSFIKTSNPEVAKTCAIPSPICPAPTTPISLILLVIGILH